MRALRNFLVRLFLLITVIGILFGVVFGLTPMANADMQPAVCAGDLMLYYRLGKNLNSDDVVVFQKEGIQYTGRIVAVPGDVVEITDESELMVNKNTVMEDNIFYTTPAYDSEVEYPLALKEDQYFILCDNREGAKDSRSFGVVDTSEIKGKVITIVRRSGI
ncbi:MAG: signal peptidase I [Ruminococcus sp.]|nr:signal peptidase I [Ruminococcus sp.]